MDINTNLTKDEIYVFSTLYLTMLIKQKYLNLSNIHYFEVIKELKFSSLQKVPRLEEVLVKLGS